MDLSQFDENIQIAFKNLLTDIEKIKTKLEKNEELKEITKKILTEINEDLQKLKSQ